MTGRQESTANVSLVGERECEWGGVISVRGMYRSRYSLVYDADGSYVLSWRL